VGADGVEKRLCGRVIGRPAAAGQSPHCARRAPCSEDAVAPQRHRLTHAIFQDRGRQRALEGISGAAMGGLGRIHRGIGLQFGLASVQLVNMTISLAFLAPRLVKAAVAGRLPQGSASPAWSPPRSAIEREPRPSRLRHVGQCATP
jgi:hypothetical protein